MDKFRIDSHKLIYHVSRLNDWLNGKNIYPIYAEIAPSGACNHRCTYCALDYLGYQPRFLDTRVLKKRISEMARLGLKSIMYAGEGEPFLHKDIGDIINHTKKSGIDVAITTNGVLFTRDLVDKSLANISWVKASINGATSKTYALIHRTSPADFKRVIGNLSYAADFRRRTRAKCTLGMQLLLLPENAKEVALLGKMAKEIGMDYLVVKPYSQHPFSRTTKYSGIKYNKYLWLADRLKGLNSERFSVIFRINTMKKWDDARRCYAHCNALDFWVYIDAAGDAWGCSAYLGDKRFKYGNISKNTFKEIWEGAAKKKIVRMAQEELDTRNCRVNCRMDEINRYLWELKHPPEHVNFI